MAGDHVKKICSRCGAANMVAPRQRRCKVIEVKFGGRRVWCYGPLRRADQKPKRVRRTLEQELEAAHVQLTDAITRVKRAVTSVDHWQRKIKRIGRRIDERDHPKPKQPKPHKRTRLIMLPDEPAVE